MIKIKERFRTCLSVPRLVLNFGREVLIGLVQTAIRIMGKFRTAKICMI